MDSAYRTVYQRTYDSSVEAFEDAVRRGGVIREDPVAVAGTQVASFIDSVGASLRRREGVAIRPDAKLLLLLNFFNLIVTPVLAVGRIRPRELSELIEQDVTLLIMSAERDGESEISAHAVLDSLSRNWRKLRLSEFRIWE